MCCTNLQVLFHVLQVLSVATTGSTDDIKLISEFIPNAPQHVAVHRVDCRCFSIFHVLNICWKRCSITFVINIPSQLKITQGDLEGKG